MRRTRAAPRSRWPIFDGALRRALQKTRLAENGGSAPRFDAGRRHNAMSTWIRRTRRCPATGGKLRIAAADPA